MYKKEIIEERQGEVFVSEIDEPLKKRFYIESYGCAMNFNDSEIVASILQTDGYTSTKNCEEADLILINTCSIRDKAEQTIRYRLQALKGTKKQNRNSKIGILGCMAERLKAQLLEEEKLVDLVVGPDAYRTLPELIKEAETGEKAVNVLLSREETYEDISPVRLDENGVSAFVSIMRGCNNMCSFCVVPFTRGRERSRNPHSILNEVKELIQKGYKEITLLGQNVDSYHWEEGEKMNFAQLLENVALQSENVRIRFSTSHPKDITDEVLHSMAKHENICKCIHLPVQSGSTRVLQLMNRTYTNEWYKKKVDSIRKILPDCAITSDIITGFCTETDEDHQDTLDIIKYSKYNMSYMYFYSERPGTLAQRRFEDDIPLEIKKQRLTEVIALQKEVSKVEFMKSVGKTFKVLIEDTSRKNPKNWVGRNSQNQMLVFGKENHDLKIGDYIFVKVHDCSSATLFGDITI